MAEYNKINEQFKKPETVATWKKFEDLTLQEKETVNEMWGGFGVSRNLSDWGKNKTRRDYEFFVSRTGVQRRLLA